MFTAQIVHDAGRAARQPSSSKPPPISARLRGRAKEAGQLLDDISLGARRGRGPRERRLLPRHHAVHRPRCRARPLAPVAGRARAQPHARGRRRLPEADHAHHPASASCAISTPATASPPTRGCWRRSRPGRARTRVPGCRSGQPEDEFFVAHVRAPGATRVKPKADEPVAVGGADRGGARPFHRCPCMALTTRPSAGGSPIFLLDRCCVVLRRDHRTSIAPTACSRCSTPPASRWRATTSSRPTLLGSVARRRMRRCLGDLERGRRTAWARNSRACSATSAPCTAGPASQVIAGVMRDRRESGGAQAFIEDVLQPAARIIDDIRNARHERVAAVGRHRPVPALSRLALVCRLEAAGDAVVARRTARMRRALERFLRQARSPGLRHAHPGDRRLEARPPLRRGDRSAIEDGRDLDGPDSPLAADARRSCAPSSTTCATARAQRLDGQAPAAAPDRR